MKPNSTIQFKALILFIIFSLNTVLSFACSLGLDMWYNSGHHATKNSTEFIQDCCEDDEISLESNEDKQSQKENEDCCTKSVIDFQMMTKSIIQPDIEFSNSNVNAHEYGWSLFFTSDLTISAADMKWAVFRTHKRPPPDIRVSIRSFQI